MRGRKAQHRDTSATPSAIVAFVLLGSALAIVWAPPPVRADQGEPSVCGYRWTDSHAPPPQVNFTWVDIVGNGTKVVDWNQSSDDGFAGPFPLGFAFVFYDVVYTDVFIETNGYVSFGKGWGWTPYGDVHPEPPNNYAAAYGIDLDPGAAAHPGGVYYQKLDAPDRFVVEFYQVPFHNNYSGMATFEIILYSTGEIWFQYLNVGSNVSTIGIEDSAGSAGLLYDRDAADGLAVQIAAPVSLPAPVAVDLSPCNRGILTIPGAVEDLPLNVTNAGTAGEDVFDLTVDAPSPWRPAFYEADGVTLLDDTDGDSVPDTGTLSPSASRDVLLRIEVPAGVLDDTVLNITATSSNDARISDSGYGRLRIVPARFAPPHTDAGEDLDADGQFDVLELSVDIEVGYDQDLYVFAYFHDEGYSIILDDYEYRYFRRGIATLAFTYDGRRINASDQDGPYYVDLALYDPYGSGVIQRDIHATAAYSHLEFETPMAALRPPHVDFGADTDEDGQFDYLVVDANVSVSVAGWYYLSLDLCGRVNGSGFCASTSNETYLEPGTRSIRSLVDGRRINASGIDGPYLTTMHLYQSSAWEIIDREEHSTAPYRHVDFETPPAAFASPHSDSPEDLDGDGLFDFLHIDTRVSVLSPGQYTIGGNIHDSNYSFSIYAYNTTFLDTTTNSVRLSFDGFPINQSGADGPYIVDLWLYQEPAPWDNDVHITEAYESEDFNGLRTAAAFWPPHVDAGRDTDGDGAYNYLVVETTLYVREAGDYIVEGRLRGSDGGLYLVTSNRASLGTGVHSVELFFEGQLINASGVNGPYTVDLTLYSYYYGWLDNDTHVTEAYGHGDFDGPPARFVGPHGDRGDDTDRDGRFNFLVVDVNVATEISSLFHIEAGLSWGGEGNGTSFLFQTKEEWLENGTHTIEFRFDGVILNATGVDGPYRVDLRLWDRYSGQFMDNDTFLTEAYPHDAFEELPSILSRTGTAPTIDGSFSSGEWSDAVVIDMSSVEGNGLAAYLYVKDDNRFLYIAYDVVGDTVNDPYDVASIAFDTSNDGKPEEGHEDAFLQGTAYPEQQAHAVWTNRSGWSFEDFPYNPDLPNHTGLASAYGFGSSPRSGTAHRIFEFAIPLGLIQARPGEVIGFQAGSPLAPGVGDGNSYRYSAWPFPFSVPLYLYGDLQLSRDILPPSVAITAPSPSSLYSVDSIDLTWVASDVGLGIERFDLSVDGDLPRILGPEETSIRLTGLSDGLHTITLTAWDGAGNSRTAEVTVMIDTTSPTVEITLPANRATLGQDAITIAWAAQDLTSGIDRFEVSLDGGSTVHLTPDLSSYTFLSVADGSHRVTVVAFDEAGHAASAYHVFFVDTVRPVLSIQNPGFGLTLSTRDVSVSWFAVDLGSGLDRIEISLDGGIPIVLPGNASGHTFVGLADGPHTLVVSAFDLAGNRLEATAMFRVDTNPLSPSGGYGILPVSAIVAVIAAAVAIVVWRYRTRRPPTS